MSKMLRHRPLKLIRASAGSGKTYALTAHYLALLLTGTAQYREVLAVTFTNKATAEMKERILGALEELASSGYEQSKFGPVLKDLGPGLSDTGIREKAARVYSNILHDYSRFSVTTIDRFIQQIIRSFAFELNLDTGYKIEMNLEKVKDDLINALNIYLEQDAELLDWVTTLAIDRISGDKDWDYHRTLKELADEIFKERYYPFQDAMRALGEEKAEEFTKLREVAAEGINDFKSAIVEKARLAKNLFDQSGIFPERLYDKSRNPLTKLDKIVDGDIGRTSTLRKVVDDFDQWAGKLNKNPSEVRELYELLNPEIKRLVEYFDAGIQMFETYEAIHQNTPYLRLMQGMNDLLQSYRSENRTMLISDAQQLLKDITSSDGDNPSFIWEKTGNKYKHFLFDEFQDTSTSQWKNFLPLVKNAIAGESANMAGHLIVGDLKQPIYRWRNGDWRILHSLLRNDLRPENVSEENLEYNRRSSENIIRFNNFLYATLPRFLQGQLNLVFATDALQELHEDWELEKSSLIERAYEGSAQKITDSTAKGGRIEIKFFMKGDEPEEEEDHTPAVIYAVDKLVELLELGVAMADIGILVGKNAEAEEMLNGMFSPDNQERLNKAAGKVFQVISGEALKIANDPAVQLLISTFRLLAAPEQESGIFKAECARLWHQLCHPDNEYIDLESSEWVALASGSMEDLENILPVRLCREFNSLVQLPVTELTETLIGIYGNVQTHISFLLALRDQIASFSAAGDQGLASFLEWWDIEGSAKALPASENQDAVQVMTIHKSKGLEFRAVIIPFMNWKLNSSHGSQDLLWVDAALAGFERFNSIPVAYKKSLAATVFAAGYFEEMLLRYMDTINKLYVATTRAKDYLCIICPKTPPPPSKAGLINDIQLILSNLLSAAADEAPEFVYEDNCYVSGEMPFRAEPAKVNDNISLMLNEYVINEQATQRFKRNNPDQAIWFNSNQRKGVVIHELLGQLDDLTQLDKLIDEKLQEGLIRSAEKAEIRKSVLDVLSQEQIHTWFKTARRVISEKDIILEDGSVKRPDKVFVFDDYAVLLDFKFGSEYTKYAEKIRTYRDSLMKMGTYGEVHAYLWYAGEAKLQRV